MTKAEQIYDLMNGSLNLEEYPELNIPYVKNEFEEGSPCELPYTEVYEAKERLQRCLGKEGQEDRDIEMIITNMEYICKNLAMKMYEYGYQNGMSNQKNQSNNERHWEDKEYSLSSFIVIIKEIYKL